MSKTIIRVQKDKNNPYVLLNKYFLEDERLSFKAKGILAYLLSKPDNWKVRPTDLIKISIGGKESVYSGLKELENNGYLIRNKIYINGRISHWEQVIFEVPQHTLLAGKPEIAQSIENTLLAGNQDVGFLDEEKPDNLISNDLLINNDHTKERIQSVSLGSIKNQINFNELSKVYDKKLLNEIVFNILDMYSSDYITVDKIKKNNCIVRAAIDLLTYWHIEYAINKLKDYKKIIKNKKAFMQSVIFNSVFELESDCINFTNIF